MSDKQKKQTLERMDDAWDRMSADYAQRLKLDPSDEHYVALARQIPRTDRALEILDLGSGLGYQLDALMERLGRARFTCLDVSGKMLEGLMARLGRRAQRVTTRKQSYVKADLGDTLWDYVVSSLTVHHLVRPTKLALFGRIHAALKPGGLYVELDDVASPATEKRSLELYEQHIAGKEGDSIGEWNHNMNLTIPHERELLEQAGFAEVTVPWRNTDDEGFGRAVFVCRK
jgi:tRNA (cmo5U34)-methyltransferase